MTTERKVRMTMPNGSPVVVIKNPHANDGKIEALFMFALDDFEYKDGNMKWVMSTPEGVLIQGGLGEVVLTTLPNHGDISVALSIPVTLHKHTPIFSPEFILMIPEHLRVYTLNTLKKKYGTGNDLFR